MRGEVIKDNFISKRIINLLEFYFRSVKIPKDLTVINQYSKLTPKRVQFHDKVLS